MTLDIKNEDAIRLAARVGAVAEIQAFVASLPDVDPRPADEILGYDESGLPS